MKIIIFTLTFDALGLAYRLKKEGREVALAVIQDLSDIITKVENKSGKEKAEEKRLRLSSGDGVVEKVDAWEAVKMLQRVPKGKRKDWFVFSDLNHCWKPAQELKDMGFPGLFPTEEDRLFEVDRMAAKEFVEEHYPDLETAEVHEFKAVDEADELLEDTEDVWVAKGFDENAETFVPTSEDPEIAAKELRYQLEKGKDKYEKSGFILERKIIGGYELTPEMCWWDGKPLYATVCVELKRKAAGNMGEMVGCAADLVFEVPLDCGLMELAIPPEVHRMAAKRKGLFVWDAAVIFKDGSGYYLESCPQRKGWNSFLSELAMLPDAGTWFDEVAAGRNPLAKKVAGFGASVRMFNDAKEQDVPVFGDEGWPMDMKKGKEGFALVGYTEDAWVSTGTGDDPQQALLAAARNAGEVSFKKMTYRPAHDLVSRAYQGNILSRYMFGLDEGLYEKESLPTLLVDFDDTLWDADKDEPMAGAADALAKLSEDYRVVVYTARDVGEVEERLGGMAPYVAYVTQQKESAVAYVDDKALRFDGSWDDVLYRLRSVDLIHKATMDLRENPPQRGPVGMDASMMDEDDDSPWMPQGIRE